jgi:hypothetical protein
MTVELKAEEITDVFYKIEFKGVKKEMKFIDAIHSLKNEN